MATFCHEPLRRVFLIVATHTLPPSWVIVGSGFYPWLVAFFLQQKLITPIKHAGLEAPRLTVVEEKSNQHRQLLNTTSSLRYFNKSVGLSEANFVKACQACFNLGTLIERKTNPVENGIATPFFFAEGPYGFTINGVRFHHLLSKYLAQGEHATLDAFSINAQMAMQNRFTPPSTNPDSLFAAVEYGYRFSAANYRDYLVHLLGNEIDVIHAEINKVKLTFGGDEIAALQLDNGHEVKGSFFIDVSEKRPLKSNLSGPLQPLPAHFPDDVFISNEIKQDQKLAQLKPYQQITLSAGELLFETTSLNERYTLRLSEKPDATRAAKTFCDPEPWQGNCVALGPALSNRSPIIIDEIHSLLNGLSEFATFWPRQGAEDANKMSKTWFNRRIAAEIEQITDIDSFFLQASFQHLGAKPSKGAKEKVSMFCETGVLPPREHQTLTEDQWIALMQAFGTPLSFENILATQLDPREVLNQLDQLQQAIKQAVSAAPLHEEFLRSNALLNE